MKIERLLIVPDAEQMQKSMALAQKYNCGFEYNDFYVPEFLEQDKQVSSRIKFYQEQKKIGCQSLHGAFFDVTVFSDDPRIVEASDFRVEQSLSIARSLGVSSVVFHTNFIPNFGLDYYCENWVNRNADYWAKKLDKYPDINIYMENMFDMSHELLGRLAQRLNSYNNFGVCFDYAHAHAFGDETQIESWVKALAPYVKHIHINDNDLKKDLHLAVGEGNIDWTRFKIYYETYFSQASVLIEMKDLDAAERSLEYLQKL